MNTSKTRVALTGFGGLDNPEPGTAVARSLRAGWKGPLEIEALCYDVWDTGGWMPDLANRMHLVTPISNGDEAVFARLKEIHKKHPFDALIPNLDLEVPAISRLGRRLERLGVKTLLPAPEDVLAVTKTNLPNFCYAQKIHTPRTHYIRDVADVPLNADRFGYPLYVKGTVAGAKKVNNAEEASHAAAELHAKWGGGVLLQEAIEGEEYVVGMVARADESCLAMATMRKLGINKRGKAAVGAIVENPDLRKQAMSILAKLHWRGPLELEFVQSERDNRFYLLEVNCRFPSWILLSQFAGNSLPNLLLNEILGTKRRLSKKAKVSTAFVRDVQETAVPIETLKHLKRFGTIDVPKLKKSNTTKGKLIVGVTGISSYEVTEPGLGIARALRGVTEVGKLHALAYSPYDTCLHRKSIFDAGFMIPGDGESNEKILDRLSDIQKSHGLDIIIPTLDAELERFQTMEPKLKKLGIQMLLPSKKALKSLRKDILFSRKTKPDWGGFLLTPTRNVKSRKDLIAVWKAYGSPLVLKGQQYGAATAYSLSQAESIWENYQQEDHDVIIAQPLIHGEEIGIATVSDRKHHIVESLTMKSSSCASGEKLGGLFPWTCPSFTRA